MLIIFDKTTGKRINDFGRNPLFPDGVPYDPQPNEAIYRIHDDDPWVQQYLSGDLANVTATIVNGEVDGIQIPAFVAPAPLPQPPSIEERLKSTEDAITVLMGL